MLPLAIPAILVGYPMQNLESFSRFLTPDLRSALTDEIAGFPTVTQRRGQTYVDRGNVVEIGFDRDNTLSASVSGTHLYGVIWVWDGQGWFHDCSCPVSFDCKHAYAVARVALRETPQRVARTEEQETETRAQLQDNAFRALSAAADEWDRHGPLRTLLSHAELDVDLFAPNWVEILQEEDRDMFLWLVAQELALEAGADAVPASLKPFLARADLDRSFRDRGRRQAADAILAWARERRSRPKKSVRFLLAIEPRTSGTFLVHSRVTSTRLRDESRTVAQLWALAGEAQREPGILEPRQHEVLQVLLSHAPENRSYTYREAVELDAAELVRVLEAPGAGDLFHWASDGPGGIAEGAPVILASDGVRIDLECIAREDVPALTLSARWPDGRARPLDEMILMARRSTTGSVDVLVDGGTIHRVVDTPPAHVRELLGRHGGLELEPGERTEILGTLASQFESVQRSLKPHTRIRRVRPVVAVDLRGADWLQFRLFAASVGDAGEEGWSPGGAANDDQPVFEFMPTSRWERLASTPAGIGDAWNDIDAGATPAEAPIQKPAAAASEDAIWLELPDPDAVKSVTAWLVTTGAERGAIRGIPGGVRVGLPRSDEGWWLKATKAGMAAFGRCWDERPRGVAFYGTPAVRRLLAGDGLAKPSVRVEQSGLDWFSVSAEWQTEGLALSDDDLAKLRSSDERFVKLAAGWVQRTAIEEQEEVAEVFADLGIDIGAGEQRVTMWQLAGADQQSIDRLHAIGQGTELADRLSALRSQMAQFSGLPEVQIPESVHGELRDYQKRGVDFLAHTSGMGLGAILADDMGLGKTLQALTWLELMRRQEPGRGPALVVCPASVAFNWIREAERFVPGLRILHLARGAERLEKRESWRDYDLLITNYALLRQDEEFWTDCDLGVVILDEAQNIKNPDAAVTRVAWRLQANHRLALTGTPLENRALDLWSIMEFVNPGYFGNRADFSSRYDRPELPSHRRRLLAAKLRPVMIRRMKREVAKDLPERIEERMDCELTSSQRQAYLAELRRSRRLVDDLSEQEDGIRRNKIEILAALTRLRQICCHPALTDPAHEDSSGKFDALFESLEPLLDEGHKVLVFSQFTKCLALLEPALSARGISHYKLTGRTRRREEIVDQFQNDPDPCVFLVSLKAGGTGLNLTAASYVVLFDPWWNPAVEAQAIDRTHRIGQDKTVIAYRMIALGTIEEKIWELQQRKASLISGILEEDGFARSLSKDDLDYLLAET